MAAGASYEPSPAEFFQRRDLSGKGKGSLRAGAELLFLSGGSRGMSDRFLSGGGRLIEIQLFLLYNRISHFVGSSF